MGGIVKNAPNSLIWAVLIAFLGVLGSFTIMAATGSDSTDLRTFLNTVLNIVGAVGTGGTLVVAGAAYQTARRTEQQTNGLLDEERQDIAKKAAAAAIAEHIRKDQASDR